MCLAFDADSYTWIPGPCLELSGPGSKDCLTQLESIGFLPTFQAGEERKARHWY